MGGRRSSPPGARQAIAWTRAALDGAEAHCRRTGRPLVTLSYAQSLDGCLSARRGEPFALSGPESLALTHQLRAAHAGILVGIGTLLADDPRLNVRLTPGADPQPVVLDSRLRFPPGARLLAAAERRPWIATTASGERAAALEGAGARLLAFPPDGQGRVPLPTLLERLAALGLDSLMVEGGAQVLTSFLSQGLADLAVVTVAPLWLGGLRSVEAPLAPGGLRLEQTGSEQLGEDIIVWGRISKAAEPAA